jgi:TolB-like protein
MTTPDIFLSYNREDQATAKLYADAFAAEGLNVWWDTALRSGEAYDEVTEAALRGAKAVVVLWSPRSVVSRWVRAEATIADRCKTLVPVTIEPCERPIMFELTQTAELSHWTGDAGDRAWLAFLSDVRRFVGGEQNAASPVSAASVGLAPAAQAEPMLAVLPFDNLSNDAEMDFFSDGVSEEIIGLITRGSQLKVIGRTSSFRYRGEDKQRAARELGASHVLDGSIRRSGEKVRVSAHLTESSGQASLWSERFDRELTDIFAIQDEIAEAIAAALHSAFARDNSYKPSPAIYDLYLKSSLHTLAPDEMREQIALLETVTKADPRFAAAWGRLAYLRALLLTFQPFTDRPDIAAQIERDARNALDLDSENIDALLGLTIRLPTFGAFSEADSLVERIRGLPSVDGKVFTGRILRMVGRLREGSAEVELAYLQDPQNPIRANMLALGRMAQGHEAEAVPLLEEVIARHPGLDYPVANLMRAHAFLGNWDAIDRLRDPASGHSLGEFVAGLPFIDAKRDPTPRNRAKLRDDCLDYFARTGVIDISRLVYAAHMGFAGEIYDLLDGARLGPQGTSDDIIGPDAYATGMLFWSSMPEVRTDRRFARLCARLGLVEFWIDSGKWPDCATTIPYDFRAECEKYRDHPKDVFFA